MILNIFSGISLASVSHEWPGHPRPQLDLAFLLPWLDQNPDDPDECSIIESYSTLFQDRFPMQLQITPADSWNHAGCAGSGKELIVSDWTLDILRGLKHMQHCTQ